MRKAESKHGKESKRMKQVNAEARAELASKSDPVRLNLGFLKLSGLNNEHCAQECEARGLEATRRGDGKPTELLGRLLQRLRDHHLGAWRSHR